ncbi:Holliday junction DNA helicase RuvA [Flavobacteria bacterium MS024-3C]|jgi:Holliday junction DNA helicase RuvA|nr:Holliday junction DNA helicase RuvA [Flavobacteria bacterium MS024-3C]KRO80980.1 MAG: ATP-dependent DNA helicase RuvA [Polaribacter sp. BACL8 MAG-120531-bin13]KRP14913.1 MAG: ATP-dependent DNA helicase RuvA [Polaribacter sp. BACL8 MAG-120419-bin8]MBT5585385.1 Holliday junction branch migration protein RuvA [Flavobacteriaceae bacterium]NQV63691.1 Holliday junction branch migration protein RuvA [Cryomorphaceae bacterium]|tara:strand:- start:8108 stop:8689 length:582 start_codon:yes stop_codon:yes gene_type:complete
MITHLRGKLVEKNPTEIVVECGGVGYLVHISLHTYSLLPSEEAVSIYTHLQVKEDSHSLYGFMEVSERAIFRLLISVSGIGANTARTMLSSLSPEELRDAIAASNVGTIQSVKGIGLKTAQRVIIELKDKILKIYDLEELSTPLDNTNKEEALSALEVLGFARKQSEKMVEKILKASPSLSVEDIIKQTLKGL